MGLVQRSRQGWRPVAVAGCCGAARLCVDLSSNLRMVMANDGNPDILIIYS